MTLRGWRMMHTTFTCKVVGGPSLSDAKSPVASEAPSQKRVEPLAQPASAGQEFAQPTSGVALLRAGSLVDSGRAGAR